MPKSLITTNQDELPLDLSTVADFAPSESRGVFTGDRLFVRDPERYRAIVTLMAQGAGILKIAKLLNVSAHTVIAVRDREGAAIAIEKERLSNAARAGAQLCVEGIVEDLASDEARQKISARDKAIIMGVLTEKSELLAGGATHRIEFVKAEAGHNDFNAYLDKMRRVDGETHLEGEGSGQKGLPPSGSAESTEADQPDPDGNQAQPGPDIATSPAPETIDTQADAPHQEPENETVSHNQKDPSFLGKTVSHEKTGTNNSEKPEFPKEFNES